MIVGGPTRGDLLRARKAYIREDYRTTIKEVMDVEPAQDTPLIQFGQEEQRGPSMLGNDALVPSRRSGGGSLSRCTTSLSYIEAIKKSKKRSLDETLRGKDHNKRGKDLLPDQEIKKDAPVNVQPIKELLTIKLIPGHLDKVTKIGSKMKDDIREEIIKCIRKNKDIFAWTPQDLEGRDPGLITHHLNIDPNIKPVKQKKRHFGLEKDRIIQAEVNKLLTASNIKEIQFLEWLSSVVFVLKPGEKWKICIDFSDLNKACSKDFYPLL
ncbi:UNVERIFIED_CONTAM: hypothetical protein Sradi_0682100 [Sesamum radiatum]|uniref:Reverse transcriptase domain-containing protein n=1 Tax=Sesamum radiatum TaxID=300843 RepID=A0AAW2VQ50_SESRA